MRPVLFSLFFLAAASVAGAETLPLPQSLIALNSAEGGELLLSSQANADYFDLGIHFTSQVHPAFCEPATIATVLKALEVERPKSQMTPGLGLFDQENVLTPETEAVKSRARIERAGPTLDELAGMFGAHEVSAETHHAEDSSLDAFRSAAIASVRDGESFVLVNYLRAGTEQERGGHISPLGACDAETDRFLILDVSRYRNSPVWQEAVTLFDAMNTPDSDNDNRSRGYLLVFC